MSRLHLPLSSGEIRILTLHAGNVPDPIKCSLQVVVLDEEPVYEALSYTWGDPGITKAICVKGTQVDVTVNLESALRYVRRHKVIWDRTGRDFATYDLTVKPKTLTAHRRRPRTMG
jgi:hypothetical protein